MPQSPTEKGDFYAHTRTADGETVERQLLRSHLRTSANYAGRCLRSCGLEEAAYLGGLVHDLGKYSAAWQSYLLAGNRHTGKMIHTFQGSRFLLEKLQFPDAPDTLASEILACAVGAHHGLFDCVDDTRKLGLKERRERQGIHYEEAVSNFFSDCASEAELEQRCSKAAAELEAVLERLDAACPSDEEYLFAVGMLVRLLTSAIMEGDRRDTAEFVNHAVLPQWPEDMRPVWSARLRFMEDKLASLPQDTPVAPARSEISRRCLAFAKRPNGIYRLNVPTGSGKTLSTLRYALAHAAEYGNRRIFYTAPLLSILEQNAAEIRKYVGDNSLILEHHSNVVQTEDNADRDELDLRELLVQTWDAPVVITTMVQLLNTLFSGKTTCVRRFHSLCNSIIIIDEVQAVPSRMLTLFIQAIRFLSGQCGADIILCSATQPCLERAVHPLPQPPEDMIPYDAALWAAFARTRLEPLGAVREEGLPDLVRQLMEDTRSLLVVCNTKAEAARLYERTKAPDWTSFHLSAGMCTQHRRDILRSVYYSLNPNHPRKVLCISTQVVEAGVDISFQRVLRLAAGMDNVVQSAGRCNRNGETQGSSPVYLVNCSDEQLGKLREIQSAKAATLSLLEAYSRNPDAYGNDLTSDAAIRAYYETLYRDMPKDAQDYPYDKTSLFDLLSCNSKYADENCEHLEDYALWQAFRTAGSVFTVFEEDTVDALVPYGRGRELIEAFCSERAQRDLGFQKELLKQAASFTVALYTHQKKALEKAGALRKLCGGCVLAVSEGFYDEEVGLKTQAGYLPFLEVR